LGIFNDQYAEHFSGYGITSQEFFAKGGITLQSLLQMLGRGHDQRVWGIEKRIGKCIRRLQRFTVG
jgi:hypothetical protein